MNAPSGLPTLPLPGAGQGGGEGSHVELQCDRFGRWIAHLIDDDTGERVDRLEPEETAFDALMATARNYPQATYTPYDEAE